MNARPELAAEDALRLAVLLAGEAVQAIRLDEGNRMLHALTARGEAHVPLHPVGRPERYFTAVREVLGGHALDSPGGYPVHLRRWTRMGQASAARLEAMLRLGEDEAVTAVAHAPNLTDELARRVWWALPTSELARVMLQHEAVRAGAMADVLSAHLLDHLPFDADPIAAMHSVRAIVAAGRLDADAARALWVKGKRRPHYLIGFLEFAADALPEAGAPRPLPAMLAAASPGDSRWVAALVDCHGGNGQAWLKAAQLALDKPPAHDAVYRLLALIAARFAALRDTPPPAGLCAAMPDAVAALGALAHLDDSEATALLAGSTAVGPLMRRKLAPVLDPLLAHLRVLAP